MTDRAPLDPAVFKRLPEPVRLDDTITSEDTLVVAPEKNDELREVEWLLRSTGI
jgi:hypothetical protein